MMCKHCNVRLEDKIQFCPDCNAQLISVSSREIHPDQSLRVRYTNVLRDAISFSLHMSVRSPINIIAAAICFIAITRAVFITASYEATFDGQMLTFLKLELITVFMVSILTVGLTVVSSLLGGHRGFLTEHILTLSDESFIEETAFNITEVRWIGVQKICESKKYIYIYISRNSAHVVPKRIFNDKQSQTYFYDLLIKKWKAGTGVESQYASSRA